MPIFTNVYHHNLLANVRYVRTGTAYTAWIHEQHMLDLCVINKIARQLGLYVEIRFDCTALAAHRIRMTIANHRHSVQLVMHSTWFLRQSPSGILMLEGDWTPNLVKFYERIRQYDPQSHAA